MPGMQYGSITAYCSGTNGTGLALKVETKWYRRHQDDKYGISLATGMVRSGMGGFVGKYDHGPSPNPPAHRDGSKRRHFHVKGNKMALHERPKEEGSQ